MTTRPQIDKEAGFDIVELAIRQGLAMKACSAVDTEVTNLVKSAALVVILASKTREDAILMLDDLIDAIQSDLRKNTQGCVNDSFDNINEKVRKMVEEAAPSAIESFNAIQRAKHTDEAR